VSRIAALFILLPFALASVAEEVRYISDQQTVPLRSGQGTEYRIVHRGLPTGTRLTVDEVNEETGYSHVSTANGTEGWILSRYLMREPPAAQRLKQTEARYQSLQAQHRELEKQLAELRESSRDATSRVDSTREQLARVSGELAEVRRVSANALSLDASNRRLAQEAEIMKTRIEVLEADNLRLQESEENEAFMNGALAVIIGVIITLLVPRLWPRRRSSSSWV